MSVLVQVIMKLSRNKLWERELVSLECFSVFKVDVVIVDAANEIQQHCDEPASFVFLFYLSALCITVVYLCSVVNALQMKHISVISTNNLIDVTD